MIVDDNRDAADSLSMLLQFEGRRTLCAYSGEQALQDVAAFDPQLVLLDIGLPGLDGYEVARRLKTIVARAARDRAERLWPGRRPAALGRCGLRCAPASSPSTSTRSKACSRGCNYSLSLYARARLRVLDRELRADRPRALAHRLQPAAGVDAGRRNRRPAR